MSHFTVLIPAKDHDHLEKLLLPYHEYECTGINQYLEFVPADMEELLADYEEHGETRDLERFAKDWAGYEKNAQGIYGRWTNPNAKWDWWLVGGRWSGLLRLKDFATSAVKDTAGRGDPGLFGRLNNDIDRADYALAGDIDWEGMLQSQVDSALHDYDIYHQVKAEFEDGKEISSTILEQAQKDYAKIDRLREHFESVEELAKYRAIRTSCAIDHHVWIDVEDEEDYQMQRDEYRRSIKLKALTFAFIDLEGKWNERGNMGWWACVTNKNPDYDELFWEFVRSIPDDHTVYVVDCHI